MYSILKYISYHIQQKVDCIAIYSVVDTNLHILDLILKSHTEYSVSFKCTADLLDVKFSHYGDMFNSTYDEVDLESDEAKDALVAKIVHYFDNAIVNIMLHYQKLVNDNKNKIDSLSQENKAYILHSAEKYKALLLEAQKNNMIPDNEEIKKDMETILQPTSSCPFLDFKSQENNVENIETDNDAKNPIIDIVVSDKENHEQATSENVESISNHIENEIKEIHSLIENDSPSTDDEEVKNEDKGIDKEASNQESSEAINGEDTRDESEREQGEVISDEVHTELSVNPQPTHMQVGNSVLLSITTNADTYTFELTNENAEYDIATDTLTALKEGQVTAIVKATASDALQSIVEWDINIE